METRRIALVTGAASGMGRLMAERLAGQGWLAHACDRNTEGLDELARGSNGIVVHGLDVTDETAVRGVVEGIEQASGRIDRVAHCAAIMPGAAIADSDAASIRRLMDINYGGTVNVVQAALPGMKARGAGQLVIFGSIAGVAFSHNLGPYCATKAAVNAFAKVLIHESEGSGVDILLVCPPAVATPLIEQAIEHGPPSLRMAQDKGLIARPGEIIDAVEHGLKTGKTIIYPGQAKAIWRLRRFFPGVVWKMTAKANRTA